MSYEQQIREAMARGYCTPENSSKEMDSVLIDAMTQEVLKSVGLIPKGDSHPLDQQVSREVGGGVQDPIFEKLEKEFAEVINRNSIENWNNTPDFILAKYLIDCLKVFSDINRNREQWYGKALKII